MGSNYYNTYRFLKPVITVYILLFTVIIGSIQSHAQQNYHFNRMNVNHGLSSNQVNCFYKDKKGFIWIGTMAGLNRFDGYNFKIFKHDIHDTNSISDNFVSAVFEDHYNRLWINTRDETNIFNPETENFVVASNETNLDKHGIDAFFIDRIVADKNGNYWYNDSRALLYKYIQRQNTVERIDLSALLSRTATEIQVTSISTDSKGNLWLICRNGTLLQMDINTNEILTHNHQLNGELRDKLNYYNLFVDDSDNLWINATNDALGIFYINLQNNKNYHFKKDAGIVQLSNDLVIGIVQDNNGYIWLATDHGGINIIDKENFKITYLLHNTNDEKSINQNSVTTLFKDNSGIIWAGTFKKGFCYYHENIIKFKSYKHIPSDPNSLIIDDVNCFMEDGKGNLWIGTNGGGLDYFNRKTGKFTHYRHQASNSNGISNNIIINLLIDHTRTLWIGTYFGGLNKYKNNQFHHYKANASDPKSLSDNRVWTIFEDSQQNLWIGTLGGGLDMYDRERNIFYHYKQNNLNSVGSNYISAIVEDLEGNLWFGTAHGISMLEKKSQRFFQLTHNVENHNSLSNNNISSLIYDENDYLWIGTREGLNVYEPKTDKFKVIRQSDGLPDNVISTILKDDQGNIWMGTTNGISNLIIKNPIFDSLSYDVKNYDESDGLQGKEFNQNSALKTSNGELIFGGANGFNIIQPEKIRMNEIKPDVVFTNFMLFNNDIQVNEKINGRVILKKSITQTNEIMLKHRENMFAIEFAALNYFQPEKNKYKYRLIGFSDTWLTADARSRKVTFTNLDPGKYTFEVIASNNDDQWNVEGNQLSIQILPPVWKTKWALIFYIMVIAGLLYYSRKLILIRERTNYQIQQDKLKSQRRHELDLLKIRFFTNISHEFKTPLALIITPLEKILKNTTDPDARQQFQLIFRNARRLLNLVNQLLDFRRMEMQGIKLNLSPGEIVEFSKEILFSFTDLSEKKDIQLNFISSIDKLNTYFDQDKLEKIIFNLLSNAFKFTPEKGKISLRIEIMDEQNKVMHTSGPDIENKSWVVLKVEDSGIGIPKDKQDKIFIRFFQDDIPGSMINQGSGIGLSLVHEFVRLHNGKVFVESEQGKGSTFTVMLPVTKTVDVNKIKSTIRHENVLNAVPEITSNENQPLVLIVEDNEDFRFYLKDNLKNNYNIIEAPNGKLGYDMALEKSPDLIVSDVMMPEMDGIELCEAIKSNEKTAQIPLILLTAITSENQKVKGFDYGADDYITKPFSFEILESRIKNLITKHNIIGKRLKKKMEITISEIEITSKDEKLIQKALQLVENNMGNPDFSVEELSREIGMSRVHLYKKLLSLTSKTPIEFIRTVRLKRAAQLLEKSQLSVSEVAYKVGFNNPKYFTKYFKAEFKKLPSVYAQEKQEEQGDNKEFLM